MKAVRLVQAGQPLELHDIPVPEVGNDDVLSDRSEGLEVAVTELASED